MVDKLSRLERPDACREGHRLFRDLNLNKLSLLLFFGIVVLSLS